MRANFFDENKSICNARNKICSPGAVSTGDTNQSTRKIPTNSTEAAKSIRTPTVSPSDSPGHNSAKKRFQELKKNQ